MEITLHIMVDTTIYRWQMRLFNPLTTGAAYIRVFIFISTVCTTF